MANWDIQIKKFVNSGTRSKKPYLIIDRLHGHRRKAVLHRIMNNEIDIVLTSYHTLAADYKSLAKQELSNAEPSSEQHMKSKNSKKTVFDHVFYRIVLDEGMW
jgi:hypothetical protein